MALNVVFHIVAAFFGLDPQVAPAAQPAPAVELAESRPARVAYIEHRGPYWSLGPIIDRVARDARSRSGAGELLIRYVGDETSEPTPAAVHAQVGFAVKEAQTPEPPYQVADWPIALSARKTVDGPDGLSLRHLTALRAWARSQDLEQSGDMMAVVKLAENGESTAIGQTDIFLPVCVPEPTPPPKPDPVLLKTLESERTAEEYLAKRAAPRVTKIIQLPLPDQVQEEDAEREVENVPAGAAPTPGEAVAQHAETHGELAAQPMPTPGQELGSSIAPIEPPKPKRAATPVRQWIDKGNFAALAKALLPEQPQLGGQSWGDQIAARILAIDGALHKQTPEQEGWLAGFASELSARREALNSTSAKTARVIGLSVPTHDARETERKSVMFEFDRLMTQVSYKALTPAQVRETVADLLEAAIPLVSP